jgi:hypothetical protein
MMNGMLLMIKMLILLLLWVRQINFVHMFFTHPPLMIVPLCISNYAMKMNIDKVFMTITKDEEDDKIY